MIAVDMAEKTRQWRRLIRDFAEVVDYGQKCLV